MVRIIRSMLSLNVRRTRRRWLSYPPLERNSASAACGSAGPHKVKANLLSRTFSMWRPVTIQPTRYPGAIVLEKELQ